MAPRHSRTPVTTKDTPRASVDVWTQTPTFLRRHVFVVRPGFEDPTPDQMSKRLTDLAIEADLLGTGEHARVTIHPRSADVGTVVALLDATHPSTDAAWCLDIFSDVSGFDEVPRGSVVALFSAVGALVEFRTIARIVEATLAPSRPARPVGSAARHAHRPFDVDHAPAYPLPPGDARSLVAHFATARLEQISAGLGQTTVADVVATVVSTAVRRAIPAGMGLVTGLHVADMPVLPSGIDTPDLLSFGPHVPEDDRSVTATVCRVGAATVVTLASSVPALDLAAVLHHVEDGLRALENSAAAQFSRLHTISRHARDQVNIAS